MEWRGMAWLCSFRQDSVGPGSAWFATAMQGLVGSSVVGLAEIWLAGLCSVPVRRGVIRLAVARRGLLCSGRDW